jgi:hypothetical protein
LVIKTKDAEYDCRDITWKQSRRLHHLHTQAYLGSMISGGTIDEVSIDFDKFYEAMEFALEVAFDNPENELEGKNHAEIDEVGQAVMTQYLNPVKKNGNSV